MIDKARLAQASRRITETRVGLVQRYPFFGKLLLRMKMRFAECGTACTDMDSILFDVDFMEKLKDAELEFVMLHEVMHCVLKHCIRGKGKVPLIYNIACDITVNSFILEILGVPEFSIGGEPVMHLAPDKAEGRCYTADKIYEMLLQDEDMKQLSEMYQKGAFDFHGIWEDIDAQATSELWDKHIRDAAKMAGTIGSGIPNGIRRYLDEVVHTPKTNWRQLLHDFIQYDKSDFDFTAPDRRFQGDYLLPSFHENVFGDSVKGLWLFVDASGSVSDKELSVLMKEIYSAYEQVENISGRISFFDTQISEPVAFESPEELDAVKPVGGGGTSFINIFKYLHGLEEDQLPDIILIFTDGYAAFPEEDAAMDIPVVWLILDSPVEPPWGNTIHLYTDEAV